MSLEARKKDLKDKIGKFQTQLNEMTANMQGEFKKIESAMKKLKDDLDKL
jgi:flagellar capping protein FliD